MSAVLVRKLLRDVRTALIVVILLLFGFQILWVKVSQRAVTQLSPLFATLAERAGMMKEALEEQIFSGPGKLVQTIAGGSDVRFERAMDMLSIGYVHPLVQAILCIWAVGRAASAIAGEIDRGTMELLLAQPIARGRLVWAHLLVDAITIPLLAISVLAGTMTGYWLLGPFEVRLDEVQRQMANLPFKVVIDPALLRVNLLQFAPALLNIAGLIFAVSGTTMALSARGRFRGRVLGIAVLTFLVMFLVNVVGQLWDGMAWLRPLSVFYYYQPQQIILSSRWNADLLAGQGSSPLMAPVIGVLAVMGIVGYLIAWRSLVRRDLPAPL